MVHLIFRKIPLHYKTGISGFSSRCIIAFVQVISIPLILKAIGVNDYAVFTILCNLIVWFNLLDYGLGYLIQNKLASFHEEAKKKEFVIKALQMIFIVFLLNILIVILFAHIVQLFILKNFPGVSQYIVLFVGSIYAISISFSIAGRFFFSKHQGMKVYNYQSIIWLLILLGILILTHLKISNLYLFLSVWLLPQAGGALYIFMRAYGLFNIKTIFTGINCQFFLFCIHSFRESSPFLFYTVINLTITGVDYILIAHYLFATDVIVYNTIQKAFVFLNTIQTSTLAALYTPISESYHQSDSEELLLNTKRALKSFYYTIGILFCMSAIFILFKGSVSKLILNGTIVLEPHFIILAFVLALLTLWNNTFVMFLQACNKSQKVFFPQLLQGVLNILLIVFLVKKLGLNGIYLGLIIAPLLTTVWLYPLIYKKIAMC